MDNINFTSFKAFVMAQDESRVIDHDTFYTCAIGEYMLQSTEASSMSNEDINMSNEDIKELLDGNEELLQAIGGDSADDLRTYKELQLLLTNYEENTL